MNYDKTKPCDECPFLKKMQRGFTMRRLKEFAESPLPCHKTAEEVEDDEGGSEFRATPKSQHCAGALIFNEKRGYANQMMRIAERLGFYDASKLDMTADVR